MDVIYFSVNNWMSGEDYPPTENRCSFVGYGGNARNKSQTEPIMYNMAL